MVLNIRDEDARFLLIVLQGRLEQEVDSVHSGESDPPSSDPDLAWQWQRLARAFNTMTAQYTEMHDDLPPMMMDDGGLVRFWPEDMTELFKGRS